MWCCFLTCPRPVLSWTAVASARGTWGRGRRGAAWGRCPGLKSVTCRTVTRAASHGPRDTPQGWTATACKPRVPGHRALPGPRSLRAVASSDWEPDRGLGRHAPAFSHVFGVPKVSCHAPAVGAEAREEYVRVVDAMGQKLRAAQYNGGYFDRGARADGRLCTPEGWFSCQVSCAPFTLSQPGARRACLPLGAGSTPCPRPAGRGFVRAGGLRASAPTHREGRTAGQWQRVL